MTQRYSDDVGRVLATVKGTDAALRVDRQGTVRAGGRHLHATAREPVVRGQVRQAWTQPVGWEKRVTAVDSAPKDAQAKSR